jgi:hypothetical protein
MTAEHAAKRLDERLRRYPWYMSTGVGDTADGEVLFVYVRSTRHPQLKILADGWMGYRVLVRAVGSIRPTRHLLSRVRSRRPCPPGKRGLPQADRVVLAGFGRCDDTQGDHFARHFAIPNLFHGGIESFAHRGDRLGIERASRKHSTIDHRHV